APVASVSLLPHVFVVVPSMPAKSVQEFVAYAKANPGKLNYGAGLGTPPHLLSTLLKVKAGIDVTYIPYKGSAASITDLLAVQTHFTIDGLLGLYPLVKEGKLRALGIARAERWPALPGVPTLVESGFPDFTHDAWTGVVAPAGTPRDVLDTLNRAINDGLQSAEMKENLIRFSAIAKPGTPQDFAAFMQSEVPKWAELVKLAGATADCARGSSPASGPVAEGLKRAVFIRSAPMAIKYGRPIEARLAPVEAKRKPLLDLAKRPRRNRKAEWARRLVREHALTAHDL